MLKAFCGRGVVVILIGMVTALTSLDAQAQNRSSCDLRNPHSFACQNDAFFGRLFPMGSTTRVAGNWKTLVYTPAPQQPALFNNVVSPRNPRIPTAVTNPDRSLVGQLTWPAESTIRMASFGAAGNTITQAAPPRTNGQSVQVLLNNTGAGSVEALSCRIFVRNRADHLICQWQRNNGAGFVFMGYLGFVR